MVVIRFEDMKRQFIRILTEMDFPEDKAQTCARIFAENSLDGIYSHGVNRFPRFVEYVQKGYINPHSKAEKVARMGGIEQWDGKLAPGTTNALLASERVMQLALENGIGLLALGNTNHWMRGGTYGWHCAKKGFAFIGWTNTIANLPAWGAKECKLGNNPLVFAIPYQDEAIVLDMAMSQYSYGKMEDLQRKNEQLPLPGGFNKKDELSTLPGEILETRRPLPIGYWKGAGLSLMLDLLATILSAGLSTSQITRQSQDEYGISQVFVAIDLKQLPNFPTIEKAIQAILDDFLKAEKTDPDGAIRYPGQHAVKTRMEHLKNGIPVSEQIWNDILGL
ncbi:3-dehydro-L-gulonate 2-dehydrogenase [uncultured Sunxiuqinia sp.]|uniref:3-dehydro-L-gulonate 2-dehydrogenase n=1 Tax=uncultured Sunxiuqinia sp. TaxID=1573825 RepID=UPI002AA5ED2B|nr:3-dehydro-L-gulonate 2-dehydrogenase [uncultured Sunxiuqinia sp.]